jgi:cytochrome P450
MNAPAKNISLATLDVSDSTIYQRDAWAPYFERLRAEDPVHYCPESAFGPYWSITRYEDIVAIDSDHNRFSSEPTIVIGDVGEEIPIRNFISMDQPGHDVQRQAVQPVVAPKNLVEFESLIRGRVGEVLDGLPEGEPFDWVSRVSIDLTTKMLATIFAFPYEDRNLLPYWSDLAAGTPEITDGSFTDEERGAGLGACLEYFTRLWHECDETTGRFDLISLMKRDPNTSDMVNDPMLYLGNLLLLIVGGNDTTRNSMSGGVYALNKFPKEFDKLRADHSLIPNMVSEIIRWQTPLMHMRRTAKCDVEFRGKHIKQGDKVVMWYLSGNHDDSMIEDPYSLIIDRPNARRHMSFGFGIHRCMGNRLGEMQLRILWEEILKRFSDIKVLEEPERVKSNFVRGYSKLMVEVTRL